MLTPKSLVGIPPWSSVFNKSEDESTMCFIIRKMDEYNVNWGINYEKYKEINPDTKLSKEQFSKYEPYLKSEDTIRLFSKAFNI